MAAREPGEPVAEALQCPKCQSPMTSRLEVDGLQRSVRATCEKCGFALDLADRTESKFGGLDWLAMGLTALGLFALMTLAASLEQFEKLAADFATELPAMTRLTLQYQLPLPFLIVGGLAAGLGAWRKAKGQRRGRALLWIGCAIALLGAAGCAWAIYQPLLELLAQAKE